MISSNPKFTNDQKTHVLERILKDMDSRNAQKRAAGIKRLGQMDIQIEDIPINLHIRLEQALLDSVAEVRKEAVMTLAFLEGKIALHLLHPLLDDPIQSVRSSTISALGYIGVCPPLDVINKMMDLLYASDSAEIRDRCARTLGRLKIHQAKDYLLKLAKDDLSPTVRQGAVVALGMLELGDEHLKQEIMKLLKSETSVPVILVLHETLALIEASTKLIKD